MFAAADRLLRGFLFAALYVIHVYCSPPSRNSIRDLAVCIMRSASRRRVDAWVPCVPTMASAVQAIVALWARFGTEPSGGSYSNLDTRSDSGISDAELGNMSDMQLPRGPDGVLIAPYMRDPLPGSNRCNGFANMDIPSAASFSPETEVTAEPPSPPTSMAPMQSAFLSGTRSTPSPAALREAIPVDAKQLSALVGTGGISMSKSRMAEIAERM